MFNFLKNLGSNLKSMESKDQIAQLLKTSPEMLERFEKEYKEHSLSNTSDNIFDMNAKQASLEARTGRVPEYDERYLSDLIDRAVNELMLVYQNPGLLLSDGLMPKEDVITAKEINAVPAELRPQLSGNLLKTDLGGEPSYFVLLLQYRNFLLEKDDRKKRQWYNLFQQGLDILDLDEVTYEMLGMNPNSIGYWFPALKSAVDKQNFFSVPETKIIKVPLPILQLTRLDYFSLTPSTLKIVDDFCMRAFDLDINKTYFIKTGTYSSKFDFRNAKVSGEKEVRELGEYLLFIQSQACAMAHPLSKPVIYGVSTTNEWCVREFIEDRENNPCIYKGLPLHTEYRVFVDFDTDEILGISPYWRPDVMKKRFGNGSDKDSPHQIHDYIIYQMHEETLMKRYEENKEKVLDGIRNLIPDINLTGQWSIDIMQNGDEFWIIDMALAENSALSDCVPTGKLRKSLENWIPDFSSAGSEKNNRKA